MRSPCFGMEVIRDTFHSSGSSPSEIDMLNILATASVILRDVLLSIIAEISSFPLDLVVSSECRRLQTSTSEHRMLSQESSGLTGGMSV